MPTDREREYYRMGFKDGMNTQAYDSFQAPHIDTIKVRRKRSPVKKAVRRKKSKWQIFMGQKKNQIKLRNGKLNLKKMGVAYRKKNKKK